MADSEPSGVEKAKQIHHYNLAWGVFVELDGPDTENIKTTSNEDTDTIIIRLEGYPSECKVSKAKMAKSGFFRAMFASDFQVCLLSWSH